MEEADDFLSLSCFLLCPEGLPVDSEYIVEGYRKSLRIWIPYHSPSSLIISLWSRLCSDICAASRTVRNDERERVSEGSDGDLEGKLVLKWARRWFCGGLRMYPLRERWWWRWRWWWWWWCGCITIREGGIYRFWFGLPRRIVARHLSGAIVFKKPLSVDQFGPM